MNDFSATLTRAFAEEHHEPADGGFSVRVSNAVARREKLAVVLFLIQGLGFAAAVAACAWGVLSYVLASGDQLMASLGIELAKAHGTLTQVSAIDPISIAAGLTQFLLVGGLLAGAGVLYRNSQQQ